MCSPEKEEWLKKNAAQEHEGYCNGRYGKMGHMFTQDFQERAQITLEHLKEDLRGVRTGRAQPSLVEGLNVVVEAYGGAHMKLKELASISAPDASLLVIQPYDRSVTHDIERAFQTSDLGLNPAVDQGSIRIVIPALTQERRQQLIKLVAGKLEDARVAIRNLRTQVKKDIEDQEGTAGVSEDDIERQVSELQKAVEQVMNQIDALGAEKEADLQQL